MPSLRLTLGRLALLRWAQADVRERPWRRGAVGPSPTRPGVCGWKPSFAGRKQGARPKVRSSREAIWSSNRPESCSSRLHRVQPICGEHDNEPADGVRCWATRRSACKRSRGNARTRGYAPNRLEGQTHAELHLARALGAEDAAEVRVAKGPVRQVEVRPVEQVEDFPPELELRRPR